MEGDKLERLLDAVDDLKQDVSKLRTEMVGAAVNASRLDNVEADVRTIQSILFQEQMRSSVSVTNQSASEATLGPAWIHVVWSVAVLVLLYVVFGKLVPDAVDRVEQLPDQIIEERE